MRDLNGRMAVRFYRKRARISTKIAWLRGFDGLPTSVTFCFSAVLQGGLSVFAEDKVCHYGRPSSNWNPIHRRRLNARHR